MRLIREIPPARFPLGREVSRLRGDSGAEAHLPSGGFVTITPRVASLSRRLRCRRPTPASWRDTPMLSLQREFCCRVNRIPRDAYIKGRDDAPGKSSEFLSTGRVIKREVNNLMVMSIFIPRLFK